MDITYFDTGAISQKTLAASKKQLVKYLQTLTTTLEMPYGSAPEHALVPHHDTHIEAVLEELRPHFKKVKHVVLVGIGGSSLGVEAVHSVLATEKSPTLHVLDTTSDHELQTVVRSLKKIKNLEQLAVCVVSKSGATTETRANTELLLQALAEQHGDAIYARTVVIGDAKTALLKKAKKLGAHTAVMPHEIGGRFSVFTTVGAIPLTLLGHSYESFAAGAADALQEPYADVALENATHLTAYMKKGFVNLNFFAFDTRLVRLGKWYRQLTAESLGKPQTRDGAVLKHYFIPTISTPVELHSVGQLYLSAVPKVYTDFVVLQNTNAEAVISEKPTLATELKNRSLGEITRSIYSGVVDAYHTQELPYRATELSEANEYTLGLFMNLRILETFCVAQLIDVDPFGQPNVELYKEATRKHLGITS